MGGALSRGERAICLPLLVGILNFCFFGGYPVALGGGALLFVSDAAPVLALSVYALVLLLAIFLILGLVRSYGDAEKVKSLTRIAIVGLAISLALFLVDTIAFLVVIPVAMYSPLSWIYAVLYLLSEIALFVLFPLIGKKKA
ncbi:MAG: hypothetical protein J6D37_08955 [Clostridia bacterium]|nr:hypothetical protein [Clostridia bacterium]